MKIILVDNYDSFTYNLYHLVRALGAEVDVLKNDAFELEELRPYDGILLSPGPGLPAEAGKLMDVIKTYAGQKPILGICLGEQAIAETFGAELTNLNQVYHGEQSTISLIRHTEIFDHFPEKIKVGRYHSWVVSKNNLPSELTITAVSEDGEIMALEHKKYPIVGIQFHPESILTPLGTAILENWLKIIANLQLSKKSE